MRYFPDRFLNPSDSELFALYACSVKIHPDIADRLRKRNHFPFINTVYSALIYLNVCILSILTESDSIDSVIHLFILFDILSLPQPSLIKEDSSKSKKSALFFLRFASQEACFHANMIEE